MNEQDFADIIRLVRRTPLANMDEAEAVNALLQRFGEFASAHLEQDNVVSIDMPENPGGTG